MTIVSWEFESPSLHILISFFYFVSRIAEIAQLVEHDLAKVGVASSSLVFRSAKLPLGDFFSFPTVCIIPEQWKFGARFQNWGFGAKAKGGRAALPVPHPFSFP